MPQSNTNIQTATHGLSKEEFKDALPRSLRNGVSDKVMDQINGLLTDPELSQNFQDNLVTYTSVLSGGKYKLLDYLNAVQYVSYKMLGDVNQVAYSKVFPDRIARFTAQGYDARRISSFVSAYNATKLVVAIYTQSLIPIYIMNAHHLQAAINVQVGIMSNEEVSPKVRTEAANSLMTHLKVPETQKIKLDVTHKESDATTDLRNAVRDLAAKQRDMITNKSMGAKEVAHSVLIEAPVDE